MLPVDDDGQQDGGRPGCALRDRARPALPPEAPPRVDYQLTEADRALLVPMAVMGEWAARYGDDVPAAQDRFAERRVGQP
ncbi:winged helix-turn-helix transcriptional regulator [Kitasatospora sp. RB6PN24]|uniref:winged helix-turn-helix transcriptional regulator n=1 Tax=Kitasatospora humi TaxID=2893891 RepID=UPI001E42EFC1|nr:winged helix-turn-helix transcriptional regulator [Kitasatospora humi]MCC9309067.1 winged helix-turn-helix transcriptional regulator [Kitasatospora humi]